MGFKFWYESIIFVCVFATLVATPCFFIASFGSRMINEIGNFPTKASEIQAKSFWKIFLIEIAALAFLAVFFHVLY